MDARTNINSRLPSRHATEGLDASGGSANAALNLPAIAPEGRIEFDLFDVAEVFKKTPYFPDLKPRGRYVAKEIFEVGSIPLLMKTLLDNGHLHGDCLTVTGRTIAENLKSVKWNPRQDVARSADEPITVTGGVVGLKGNCALEGAIVKVAGMSSLNFTGPARGFSREEDAFEALQNKTCKEGEVAAIRCEGPCGPGTRDTIEVDADEGTPNVKLTEPEPAERKTKWKPRATNHTSGALWKYAQQVGSAVDCAVTHPGGAHEKQCYADI